jgi:quinol monooxygenase YgiN
MLAARAQQSLQYGVGHRSWQYTRGHRENPLIYEIAEIDVKPGSEAQFEAGVAKAVPLFRGAPGCLAMELHRTLEQPSRYRLIVQWERVENHTLDFRQSEAFQQWRALVGPYFATPPRVEHTSRVLHGF